MSYAIHTNTVATISELKKNPMATILSAHGEALAILNHNKPVFYCIPPILYEAMLDAIDDMDLISIIKSREGEESIEVNIHDL
jgi:antitoxin StbD